MAYLGNTPTTQAFTPAIDYFSGNGSTTAFTLSRPVASVAQVQVTIDNVAQNPSSAYTVSSNTITFTSAPLSGTNNIYVYYTSPITQVIAPGQGTVGTTALDVYGGAGTSATNLPSGTTAQRPSAPVAGAIRYNSTTGYPEWYSATAGSWTQFNSVPTTAISLLIVAGGGGGGADSTYGGGNWKGGGGGAGGYLEQTSRSISLGTAYTVAVGTGGSAGASAGASGGVGNNSVFDTSTALGGGYGAGSPGTSTTAGGNGGSGGGASGGFSGSSSGGSTTQANSGGATGYGFGGGSSGYGVAGGGGGAGGAGSNSVASGGGGAGKVSTITGASVTYAAGGNVAGGVAGSANTGNGGSGGWGNGAVGYTGGSGVVVLKYLATLTATYSGGVTRTSVTSGGYKIDTITATSTTSETVTFN